MVTTWLIALSDFFKAHGITLIVGSILAVILYKQLVKLPRFALLNA